MLGKRGRAGRFQVLGMGSQNRVLPAKEGTRGTGVDEEEGGLIEVGAPVGHPEGSPKEIWGQRSGEGVRVPLPLIL